MKDLVSETRISSSVFLSQVFEELCDDFVFD